MNYGNYFFAFDPSADNEKIMYERYIRLLETIYNVLNEYNINVKCKGYTFMKDAICIITDLKRMDICLEKDKILSGEKAGPGIVEKILLVQFPGLDIIVCYYKRYL